MMTEKQWLKPLILAATLFVLGSFAYWLEYNQRPKKEAAEEAEKKIFALKDVEVAKIAVVARSGERFSFACVESDGKKCKVGESTNKWELEAPIKVQGDSSNINSFLSNLSSLNPAETISLAEETPEKRKSMFEGYKLGEGSIAKGDACRIEVATTSGKTWTAYFGETHPIGETIYTRLARDGKADDSKVYLTPSHFKGNLERDLTYWRNKKLFSFSAHEAVGFELRKGPKVGSKSISATKTDALWTLRSQGEEIQGEPEAIDQFLMALLGLAAKDFAAGPESLKGAELAMVVSVSKAKGEKEAAAPAPLLAQFYRKDVPARPTPHEAPKAGTKETVVYATVSGMDAVYELEKGAINRLDRDLKSLRMSKLLTTMERFATKKIEFSSPSYAGEAAKAGLTLVNGGTKWAFAEGSPYAKVEINSGKVPEVLDKVAGTRIVEFLTGKPGAPGVPAGEKSGVRMAIHDDKTKTKEYVFWKVADQVYARDLLSKKHDVFKLDGMLVKNFPWDEKYFHAPPPAALSPSPSPAVQPAKK